jgi:proteic killer suppression protein
MEVEFQDDGLARLEIDVSFDAGFSRDIVNAFRKKMQSIRAARDERDLRAIRGNRFEQLEGDRKGQCSIRLNDQYRLIFTFQEGGREKILVVMEIGDYH